MTDEPSNDAQELARAAQRLSMQIRPLLAGKPPEVISSALADLMSLWIVGHCPDCRKQMFDDWIELTRALIPETEKEVFGPGGWEGAAKKTHSH
jgi:hypothetical protein